MLDNGSRCAWQNYGHRLVQHRHGAENIQVVPDAVQGDAGIEYFSMDGCVYQSYAPQETSDTRKAASAMKAKASRDLTKLYKKRDVVAAILQNVKIERWILLCPFLDDKAVVTHTRDRGLKLKGHGLPFLSADFQALVHCQNDFQSEIEKIKATSLGLAIQPPKITAQQLAEASQTPLAQTLVEKLQRAFPNENDQFILTRRDEYIRAHLMRDNTLQKLANEHPIIWDRSNQCIQAEEARLTAVGLQSGVPADQLSKSMERLEGSLKSNVPDVSASTITSISLGTLSDWLMRCPLDFPSTDK